MASCVARVLCGALSLLVVGCGGSAPAAAPADEPELTATAVYGRHAAVRERVDVRIANHGEEPVEVVRYRVEHPMFEPVPALERRSELPADGQPRIVPVPFGAPRCDVEDAAGARVVVGVRGPDGVRDVAVPLTDGEPGLVRAHRLACAVAAVRAAVDLDLTPWAVEPGPVGRTALRLERRGPGSVVVTDLGSSILFSLEPPERDPLLALPADLDTASVEVRARASRCETHALTEAKTASTFAVTVALDGAEPVQVPMTVSEPSRAALQDLLLRTCGPAG